MQFSEITQYIVAQGNETAVAAVARAWQVDIENTADAARVRLHHHNPIPQENRLIHIVGYQDHGDFFLGPNILQLALQTRAGQGIQGSQWFIKQQHAGAIDQPAGNRHPLRHTSGDLMRVSVDKILQAHQFDVLTHGVAFFSAAQHRVLQTYRDVLLHVEPREQAVILKHDAALQPRAGDGLAIDQDPPVIFLIEPQNQAQQRGLAAAAGADNADEFAGGDVELNVVQYLQLGRAARAGGKTLADVFQGQAVVEHAAVLLKVLINGGRCHTDAACAAHIPVPVH